MAIYQSPGVYVKETDLSLLPSAQGALRPAFIGTATKGPINKPTLITNAEQFINTFGKPTTNSYLGYSVLAYLEQGNSCFVLRVAVEDSDGITDEDLKAITVDTSGSREKGWGRIPVFAGIDHGIIKFRKISSDAPLTIRAAGYSTVLLNGVANGATSFSGPYSGSVDESFTILITAAPNNTITSAGYKLTNSAGDVVTSGTYGSNIVGSGFTITISDEIALAVGDQFTFNAYANSTGYIIAVNGTGYECGLPGGTYTSASDFVTALNAGISGATAVVVKNDDGDDVAAIRTTAAGAWIQLTEGTAFANAVGVPLYSYDIPRSHIAGTESGSFVIGQNSNKFVLDVIRNNSTTRTNFTIPTGTYTADALAIQLNANATVAEVVQFQALSLYTPSGTKKVFIVANSNYDHLKLNATYSYQACLAFAEEIGFKAPYGTSYRVFSDSRVLLPASNPNDSTQPLSCFIDDESAECTLDSAYYSNIIGWFVAKTAGSWSTDWSVSLKTVSSNIGDKAGRYDLVIFDDVGQQADLIADISFDSTATRYVGNVVNEGSTLGGVNGNDHLQWIAQNVTNGLQPGPLSGKKFAGGVDGIPPALFSSELDNAIIGNPATSTGIYALQNPESFDFNLLLIPGISSGPVIVQGLQFAENRGDILFLVDPPYGLRPQQVVDWHNGMLTSDLSAAVNSSYGALYWSWLKISDQFNKGTIFVPPSGHVAAVFARTDRNAEQWFAPAGLTYGRIGSALAIEYNPTLGERDLLYGSNNAVNSIVNLAQTGIVVWGQRTLQRADTALDRINVRMLLIYIKKNLKLTLNNFTFQQNDAITRAQVVSVIEPFLADIAGRRGLSAYKVVCDGSNNTPLRIDRNELWVTVIVQPVKVAEFIVLNLSTINTGGSVASQEVLAASGVIVV